MMENVGNDGKVGRIGPVRARQARAGGTMALRRQQSCWQLQERIFAGQEGRNSPHQSLPACAGTGKVQLNAKETFSL